MFDQTRHLSSSSSIDINRSSPITVPYPVKQDTPQPSTPPSIKFQVGSVPDTPAPLTRQSVQERILNHSIAVSEDLPKYMDVVTLNMASPSPEPMPGTNLPLEEVDPPSIVVTCPQPVSNYDENSCFSIPVVSMDTQSELPSSVAISAKESRSGEPGSPSKSHIDSATVSEHKTDPKAFREPDIAQVLRPEPDSQRSDSPMAFSHTMSGNMIDIPEQVLSKSCTLPKLDSDAYMMDEEARLSLEEKSKLSNAYLAKFAEEGWKQLAEREQRRQSTWSRHTGLYDGTGYGEVAPNNLPDLIGAASKRVNNNSDATHETLVESVSTFQDTTECEKDTSDRSESPAVSEMRPPIDEGEALQEIIRAYAHPTLNQPMVELEEAREQQTSAQMQDNTAEEDTIAYEEKMENEIKLSARVMNRSLGG